MEKSLRVLDGVKHKASYLRKEMHTVALWNILCITNCNNWVFEFHMIIKSYTLITATIYFSGASYNEHFCVISGFANHGQNSPSR